tara:strand:+ start:155 stop:355 length:201 start_codon:yes stop_codon:yes gene_type:complete
MKILVNYDDGASINEVYFAQLKDGRYIIKWSEDSNYFKVLSKTEFDKMKKDADVLMKEIDTLEFSL